jgi:hypothetical protein
VIYMSIELHMFITNLASILSSTTLSFYSSPEIHQSINIIFVRIQYMQMSGLLPST